MFIIICYDIEMNPGLNHLFHEMNKDTPSTAINPSAEAE